MDAALKKMFTRRQTRDLELASLQHTSPGYCDLAKATGTFGNGVLSGPIELRNEAATEVLDLGEGVRLSALVHYAERRSLIDVNGVRFEVPVRVGMSRLRLGE